GSLVGHPGSPWSHATTDLDFAITIHPTGRWLYSVDGGFPTTLHGYDIAADGALNDDPAITWNTGDTGAAGLVLEPTGHFGYVAAQSSIGVPGFTIDPTTGLATATPGSPFGSGSNTCEELAVDTSGDRIYFANDGNHLVTAYAIDGAGRLTHLSGSPFDV